MKFSFSNGPLHLLLEQLSGMFPTATRILALENSTDKQIRIFYFLADRNETVESDAHVEIPELGSFFKGRSANYSWLNEDELPFAWTSVRESNNVDIFKELNRNVLLLRSPASSWNGFLLLFFSKNKKHFGLLEADASFTHENREIIGQLAENALMFSLKKAAADLEVLGSLRKSMQMLTGNRKLEDRGNQNHIKLLENMIVEMAVEYLHNLSREKKIAVALSPDAREKIQAFRGSPASLRNLLHQACILAVNLGQGDPVIIESWHLISGANEPNDESETPLPVIQNRHMKLYQWLDRVEEAVKIVISGHENPTGVLVGKAMLPAVSAPAISDTLKKQGQKIRVLLNDFPDRWLQSRNHFKPLQNLLITKDSTESQSA